MDVLGVDAAAGAWIFVLLRGGAFEDAHFSRAFGEGLARYPEAEAVGVDIPIGLAASSRRLADAAARTLLGSRRSTVFVVPPRVVLANRDYAEANALSRSMGLGGVSRQAHGLGTRILEVEAFALADNRIIEVHPEVCFQALAGGPLRASKHTWDGLAERRALLGGAGIVLPEELGEAGRRAGPDDVLDAAAAAWTAARYARGIAQPLPDPPEQIEGRRVAIWY